MEWVETTGKSVDEAKDAALDQLGVDENDAEFVVLSEPKAGLFGRMRGEARVRARVRPTSPRPKRTRSRKQAQERPSREARPRSEAGARSGGRSRRSVSVAERGQLEAAEAPATEFEETAEESASHNGGPSRPGTGQARRRRSRGGSRSRGADGSRAAASENGRQPKSQEGRRSTPNGRGGTVNGGRRARPEESGATKEEAVGEELSLEEQGEAAQQFIDGLVGLLGLEASSTTSVVDDETVQVAVEGPALGILIGPGGGTLAALQELARTVVQRQTGGRTERILIDVAGYRAKRAAALQKFTRQVVEEVLASSSERALEPMSAADRKVVHDTVNEIDGVVTRSVGEEPRRYIVVAPAPANGDAAESEAG